MAEYGREGCALNYIPIVPKASIYVPKVMRKPVMGGNTVSKDFRAHVSHSEVCEVSKICPDSQHGV